MYIAFVHKYNYQSLKLEINAFSAQWNFAFKC